MTENQHETEQAPIPDETTEPGTGSGDPIAGVEISEDEKDHAVEPDENSALEVDGPQAGHA